MKDDRVYLGHIRDAIQDIEQYTSSGRDAFTADRMRQDAVIRKLEIIGEAVKNPSGLALPRAVAIIGPNSPALTSSTSLTCE